MPANLVVAFGGDFDGADGGYAPTRGADVAEGGGAEPVVFPGLEGLSVERGGAVPLSSGVGGFGAGLAFVAAPEPVPPGFELPAEPDVAEGGGAAPVTLPGLDGLSVGRGADALLPARPEPSTAPEASPDGSVVVVPVPFFFFFLVVAVESFWP